jgi:hypothetical protein
MALRLYTLRAGSNNYILWIFMNAFRKVVITVFLVVGLITSVYGEEDIIICISGDGAANETLFEVGQVSGPGTQASLPADTYTASELAQWLANSFASVPSNNGSITVSVIDGCPQCIKITIDDTDRRAEAYLSINDQIVVKDTVISVGQLKIWIVDEEPSSGNCPTPPLSPLLYPLGNCDESETNTVGTDESSGSIQVENLMDGGCQSLLISQPTGNSLKSISIALPYSSSNVQISEVGAIIGAIPFLARGKTINIDFNLNSPAEADTTMSVTCPCPLDVKLSSFKATLEAAKEQVALTWEILEGNNAYLNIWGAQMEANEFKNVTQFNTQPILIDETAPLMNFSFATNQLNLGATYFALESVDYNGECVTHCDDIDAVVLGPVEVDLESVESVRNLCNLEMKRQIAAFGNTGSCVK